VTYVIRGSRSWSHQETHPSKKTEANIPQPSAIRSRARVMDQGYPFTVPSPGANPPPSIPLPFHWREETCSQTFSPRVKDFTCDGLDRLQDLERNSLVHRLELLRGPLSVGYKTNALHEFRSVRSLDGAAAHIDGHIGCPKSSHTRLGRALPGEIESYNGRDLDYVSCHEQRTLNVANKRCIMLCTHAFTKAEQPSSDQSARN
jgi:hypothetical protein